MWCGDFRFLALLGMTQWWGCLAVTLAPVSGTGTGFGPLSSRERGLVGLDLFTLIFDSSPIKGEGILSVGVVLFTRVTLLPLWIADQVRNDGDGHTPPCGLTSLR